MWHPLAALPRAAGGVGSWDPTAPLSLVWPGGIFQEPLLRHSRGQWVPSANPARRATDPRRGAWRALRLTYSGSDGRVIGILFRSRHITMEPVQGNVRWTR